MEQREFVEIIKSCRRRMNLAALFRKLLFALSVGAGAGILFQAAALAVPFYYANLYTVAALLLAAAAGIAAAFARRGTMGEAALVMDGFGFEERIVTAYEHLQEEEPLIVLQREDAMRHLHAHRDRIRIPFWPSWRQTVLFVTLAVLLIGLTMLPSAAKDRAGELHRIREEVREKEKEIEEIANELEELAQEELTPEQQAALQEMLESLQSSLTEHQQAASMEALAAAGEKLDYKYENMSSQLSELAQSLQNGASASPATAESMQAMADKMQEMSGRDPSGETSLASNQNGSGQSGQNNGNSQSGQSGQNSGNSQSGQNNGNGQNGQNSGNGQSSQNNGNGQNSGNGQSGQNNGNGQSGQNSGNGQNGQGGSGENGQGGNGENGQGGSGNGQDGNGQGDGSGSGRGTGSSNAPHDYVSVPNAIADSGNLAGNAVDHAFSEYFRTQNGLGWEGTHVSHEAVIGSYERNAYEGIAAGRYPSGMEDVIKNYFASFN